MPAGVPPTVFQGSCQIAAYLLKYQCQPTYLTITAHRVIAELELSTSLLDGTCWDFRSVCVFLLLLFGKERPVQSDCLSEPCHRASIWSWVVLAEYFQAPHRDLEATRFSSLEGSLPISLGLIGKTGTSPISFLTFFFTNNDPWGHH